VAAPHAAAAGLHRPAQEVYNQAGEIVSELFPNEAQARVEELEADEDYNSGTP
jgi:amino-acid N-acetyltransferase